MRDGDNSTLEMLSSFISFTPQWSPVTNIYLYSIQSPTAARDGSTPEGRLSARIPSSSRRKENVEPVPVPRPSPKSKPKPKSKNGSRSKVKDRGVGVAQE